MNILIILSHPNLEYSLANKTIVNTIKQKNSSIEVRHLDELYPNFKIDVEEEQKALLEADLIVFQYPFFWYSMPAILKHYLDTVFSWGFAYGSQGDKLKGKHFIQSITVGGPQESYSPQGYNHFSIEEFLKPVEQTAYLAQLNYHKPIYSFRNFYAKNIWNSKKEVTDKALIHAERLLEFIKDLNKRNSHHIKTFVHKWFSHFDLLDENGFFIQYLASDVKMKFPDQEEFTGHVGFHNWYNTIKKEFIKPTSHQVKELKITEFEEYTYKLSMQIHLRAKTTKGKTLELHVNEFWTLKWDILSNRPSISEYIVTPKNN